MQIDGNSEQFSGELRANLLDSGVETDHQTTSTNLNEEDRILKEALQSKFISASFGDIVGILMRSPAYKHYSLSDLEWLVVPPLLAKQFTLAEARAKDRGFSTAIGVALWAKVSEEVDQKLSEYPNAPIKLRPDEWTSGNIYYLIDAVGDPRCVQSMVGQLKKTVFKDKTFKVRVFDEGGKRKVRVIES